MSQKGSKYDSPFDSAGRAAGIVAVIVVHTILIIVGIRVKLHQSVPPLSEQGVLIEFTETESIPEEKPILTQTGVEPRAKDASKENDVNLVQKSKAPLEAQQSTHGKETTLSTDGDIEVPEPPRKKEINERALFSSGKHRKDTLAPQASETPQEHLVAGDIDGNTVIGNPNGAPTAKLQGRTIEGYLPVPEYTVQAEGNVVVNIHVDNFGNVIDATPGARGTTVFNSELLDAARKAALKAKFNTSESAPAIQQGTITYIFRLR
ncbi:MAG: TonB family protein [Bacteroidales bacterium]|nr:TonB family protein [Bacteroidales bacterium]